MSSNRKGRGRFNLTTQGFTRYPTFAEFTKYIDRKFRFGELDHDCGPHLKFGTDEFLIHINVTSLRNIKLGTVTLIGTIVETKGKPGRFRAGRTIQLLQYDPIHKDMSGAYLRTKTDETETVT